jgi:mannose-6-phosphate isomerase-like protein (cupin superfamily)
MKIVQKTWGYEIWFENNEMYCGKELVCEDEKWSSKGKFHHHEIKDETFYVIEGKLLLEAGATRIVLGEREKFRVKPGVRHRFRSIGPICRFIEVSTTHSDEDSFVTK